MAVCQIADVSVDEVEFGPLLWRNQALHFIQVSLVAGGKVIEADGDFGRSRRGAGERGTGEGGGGGGGGGLEEGAAEHGGGRNRAESKSFFGARPP